MVRKIRKLESIGTSHYFGLDIQYKKSSGNHFHEKIGTRREVVRKSWYLIHTITIIRFQIIWLTYNTYLKNDIRKDLKIFEISKEFKVETCWLGLDRT
jgi:hypothetical protein